MRLKKLTAVVTTQLMILILVGNVPATAQEHVVKTSDLHQLLLEASQSRQTDVSKVQAFFSAEPGKRALRHSGLEADQVVQAVSALDNEELSRLAARVDKVNKDFAAGSLSNQQLTYIVIALATAVIILVIIEA